MLASVASRCDKTRRVLGDRNDKNQSQLRVVHLSIFTYHYNLSSFSNVAEKTTKILPLSLDPVDTVACSSSSIYFSACIFILSWSCSLRSAPRHFDV